MHKNGNISLFLLEKGADATCLPHRLACPLSSLAIRPDGTHTPELTEKLIQGGNTYRKEPSSHEFLYRRAVIEGWEETADVVAKHGLPRDQVGRELLRDLIRQNSKESLRGLRYLVEHASQEMVQDPIISEMLGGTVFHFLAAVDESIRDDDVNADVLALLLTKFSAIDTLNVVNKLGHTAVILATTTGNHLALGRLLDAGADVSTGKLSVWVVMLERLIFPDKLASLNALDGDVSTASSRCRKKRRYEENSIKLLSVLLHHQHPQRGSLKALEACVRKSYAKWRSVDLQKRVIPIGIGKETSTESPELCVKKSEEGGHETQFQIVDPETRESRPFSFAETVAGARSYWEAILMDCQITESASYFPGISR
jgi:hypothetical protein